MPKVQIIITCINLWESYTKPCIDSIKTKYSHRILVIDNGSTDQTQEEATKLVSEKFIYQRNDTAWCCSKSWNFGVKNGIDWGADYFLVLNNDILLHPETIDRLVERLEAAKRKLVALPVELSLAQRFNPEINIAVPTGPEVFESELLAMVTAMNIRGECEKPKDIFAKDARSYELAAESEHPDFSAFMLTKAGYEKIGDFDEQFVPCYFEDNDYHYRVNLAGLKAITLPTAIYYHFGSKTQTEALGEGKTVSTHATFNNNRAYFMSKWGGMPGQERFKKPFNK